MGAEGEEGDPLRHAARATSPGSPVEAKECVVGHLLVLNP